MRDYVDMVHDLRNCNGSERCCYGCPYDECMLCGYFALMQKAADAIKELLAERDHYKAAFERESSARIAAMEVALRKWISVEERLPELGQGVLVYDDCGYMSVADYTHDKHFPTVYEFHVNGEYEPGVTHWMPLPAPPKEVNAK